MNTVLIVEDEKLIRQGIRTMIQRAPVPVGEIIECKNGEEALAYLRAHVVDVMFTDIRMPKMDGITLIRSMQELPDIPLTVVISGFDDFTYAVDVLRHGVRDYVLKPIERQQIYDIMEKLEETLQARLQARQSTEAIGQQVLRALMLSKTTSAEDMQAITGQYQALFLQEPYYAVCICPDLPGPAVWPSAYAMRHIDGQDILLMTEEALKSIGQEDLQVQCAGVSCMHSGIESLHTAYEQAVAARHRAFIAGKTQYYRDIQAAKAGGLPYTVLEKAVQLLGTGNEKEAKALLDEILLQAQGGQMDLTAFAETMRQLIAKIRGAYSKVLTAEEAIARLEDIWSFENADAYYAALYEWMDGFAQCLTNEFDDYHNKQKIQQALAYIRDNFSTNMNMATVSNHVSMNYSLFSYLFKQYVGTNFVGYLQNLRIEESKRLLAETELRIHEISAKVGFQNEKHFMKLFKAITGISPSEYRRNVQMRNA